MAAKELSGVFFQGLIEHSQYILDEAERDAWLDTSAKELFDAYLQKGIDPHIPEEGTELLTDEQAMEQLKESLRPQFLGRIVCRAFCQDRGVTAGAEDIKTYVEMGISADMAENAFYETTMWNILYQIAMERLEETL